MKDTMRFTLSDTIAGYVVSFDDDENSFVLRTTDGREYTVYSTPNTFGSAIRNFGEDYHDVTGAARRHALPGPVPVCVRHLLPGAQRAPLRGEIDRVPRHPGPGVPVRRGRLVDEPGPRGGRLLPSRPVPRRQLRLAQLPDPAHPGGHAHPDYIAPDFRQETDTISRLVYGFATAYLLTGEDRFLEAAEAGTEYLREHMRFVDTEDEDIVFWYHGIDITRQGRAQDLRLGVRRRLRRHPDVRADLRARRPDADLPRHRRPAHPRRHRQDRCTCSTASSATASRAATSPIWTRSSLDPRAEPAAAQPRPQELELGRRPRAGLPDQPAPGHGRAEATPTSWRTPATRSLRTSPTTRTARSSRSSSTRTGATTATGAGSRTAPSSATT